jgi:hypothetical protein
MDQTDDHKAAQPPLDDAWWLSSSYVPPVPEHVPPLAPFGRTRPGFELVNTVVGGPELCGEVVDGGYSRFCLWDLWAGSADPADVDEQKQRMNGMQRGLGDLDDNTRYVRIQIACLDRCFWTFPGNVDLVLDGIASGEARLDQDISCEPPWRHGLRSLLQHRRGRSVEHGLERQEQVRAYITILTWWEGEADLAHLQDELPRYAELAETVYRRLGAPTTLKHLQVERLRAALIPEAFPARSSESRWARARSLQDMYAGLVAKETACSEDTIGPMVASNTDYGLCHHSYFRHIDHQLACIGAGGRVALPGAGRERARILDALTNYVHALGSWLMGRPAGEAVSVWQPSESVIRHVYGKLGRPDPRRRWLAACLWKRLQEAQADSGRGALDEHPERFAIPLDALA